ncbi:5,10-methenyltetrahydromethanopterin hydrogenase [Thalassospira tepidiphila]|uniref:5,10-methenyltetrahydromethanopterin hydrogenase n=1 Tax=Thalassospira tepidiphila TaxID=393657 RepID=A0ABX0WVX6_9PROT|nr:5,10-methenyltetrahydromethanopterin hydrogenase [Thalassospira tepidiphila]
MAENIMGFRQRSDSGLDSVCPTDPFFDSAHQFFAIDRFQHEIIAAGGNTTPQVFFPLTRRDINDCAGQIGKLGPDIDRGLEPVHVRHHDIHQDDARTFGHEKFKKILARGNTLKREPAAFDDSFQKNQTFGVIIDAHDQKIISDWHGIPSLA